MDEFYLTHTCLKYMRPNNNALVVGGVDAQFLQLPDPHVPNLATLEGTLDLFLLCIFAELGEFLDPTTYKRQRRDVQVFEHDC